jgi:hypothetical protein
LTESSTEHLIKLECEANEVFIIFLASAKVELSKNLFGPCFQGLFELCSSIFFSSIVAVLFKGVC